MATRLLVLPRLSYKSVSLLLLMAALLGLAIADLRVTALDPWLELRRLLTGLLHTDVLAVEARSLVLTVAFAVVGVGIGATTGLGLALVFPLFGAVRVLCAFLRSIHEMFWALLLINVTGLSPTTGILAIALPYSGIFAKVFAEMIEEADLAAVRVLPKATSNISAFAFATSRARRAIQELHALPSRMRAAIDLGARLHRPADDRVPIGELFPARALRA